MRKVFLLLLATLVGTQTAVATQYRIINGQPATLSQIYGTVALVTAGTTEEFCTGVLIAPKVVLTAAHCMVGDSNPSHTEVIAGVLDTTTASAANRFTVTKVSAHSGFSFDNFPIDPKFADIGMGQGNDIAVLVLAQSVSTVSVVPILPNSLLTAAYTASAPLTITGYGTRQPNGQGAANVLYIAVTVYRDKTSTELWAGKSSSNTACQGDQNCPAGEVCLAQKCVSTDTCQGDSGGPIYTSVNGTLYVAGVVSRGVGTSVNCGGGGVYTRADAYLQWITDHADGNFGGATPVSDTTAPDASTSDVTTVSDAVVADTSGGDTATSSGSDSVSSDLPNISDPPTTIPGGYQPPPTYQWQNKSGKCGMGRGAAPMSPLWLVLALAMMIVAIRRRRGYA